MACLLSLMVATSRLGECHSLHLLLMQEGAGEGLLSWFLASLLLPLPPS